MQAGGRRFDPVILHQHQKKEKKKKKKRRKEEKNKRIKEILHQVVHTLNTKAALQKAALMLIDIDRSIGCSLKIHRVKSVLLMETAHS